jgi:hypothetical protein
VFGYYNLTPNREIEQDHTNDDQGTNHDKSDVGRLSGFFMK